MFVLNLDGLWFNQLTTAKLVVSRRRDYPLELVIDDSAPSTAPVSEFWLLTIYSEISMASEFFPVLNKAPE